MNATVLLIRHGFALDPRPGLPDAERPLSPQGRAHARRAMGALVARGLRPTLAFSSPYLRAQETLQCMEEALGGPLPRATHLGLRPGGDPGEAEAWLRGELAALPEGGLLALFSHEPFLSTLTAHLTGRELTVRQASCTVLALRQGRFHLLEHIADGAGDTAQAGTRTVTQANAREAP